MGVVCWNTRFVKEKIIVMICISIFIVIFVIVRFVWKIRRFLSSGYLKALKCILSIIWWKEYVRIVLQNIVFAKIYEEEIFMGESEITKAMKIHEYGRFTPSWAIYFLYVCSSRAIDCRTVKKELNFLILSSFWFLFFYVYFYSPFLLIFSMNSSKEGIIAVRCDNCNPLFSILWIKQSGILATFRFMSFPFRVR